MKSIILCAPSDFGLFDAIKDSLISLGYNVYRFPIQDGNYKYKNILLRFNNLFHKIILGDKDFKNKLKLKERQKELNEKLESIPSRVDYALFIRPDMYPIEFIKKIKKIAHKCAAYHWDSIQRFPNTVNYIDLFERFFVFNYEDSIKYPSTKLVCNFILAEKKALNHTIANQAYFVGSDYSNRIEQIIQIKNTLNELGLPCDFTIKSNRPKYRSFLKRNGIKTIRNTITYVENLNNVKGSSVIIDLHNQEQTGLSFRIFEALNYNKKLITTNKNIINYDFYNSSNIFIWDGKNQVDLKNFLEKEAIKIESDIVDKYRLSNWIKYVMDDEPYIKLILKDN